MRTWRLGVLLMLAIVALGGCGERGEGREARADEPDATLFLAGMGEMWVVNVGSGSVEHIRRPELGAGDPPHLIAAIGERLAMWSYDVTSVPMEDPAAESQMLASDAWIFIPAAEPGRIWVGYLDRESPPTVRGLKELRETDSEGRVLTKVSPPDGAWPIVEVGGGLLFPGPRNTTFLWDPDTKQTVRTWDWEQLGDIGPASGNLLASDVYKSGVLRLTDVLTGEQRLIVAPDGFELMAWTGAFSPDGETLAVPLQRIGDQNGDLELVLLDVDTGDLELVPGSRVRSGYNFTVWSGDGDEVFLTGGGPETPRQIVAYRLEDDRATTLNVDVGDFYDVAAG